jgi:hypothetical protein
MPLFAGAVLEDFELVVGLPHRDPSQLERIFWDVSSPSSPRYLAHLSLGEVADLVGAPDEDVSVVKSWLIELGASPSSVRTSALRDTVTASFNGRDHSLLLESSRSPWTERGLPSTASHPMRLDFVLRRGSIARSNAPLKLKAASGFGYAISDQKKSYGIPVSLAATNETGLQMVWGPGTFGFSLSELGQFKAEQCPLLNVDKVKFDTKNHGTAGGDVCPCLHCDSTDDGQCL